METVKDFRTVEAYITNLGKYNEGELIGEWVVFPIDEDEEEALMERIGVSDKPDAEGNVYDEYFVTDYESYGIDLYEIFGEYPNIDSLNELAERLSEVSDYDDDKLCALIKEGWYGNDLNAVYEAIDNLDEWNYVQDLWDYGKEMVECSVNVPDFLDNYIDYEKFGEDCMYDIDNFEADNGYYYKY